jgi:DHA2 family multidrug resistance protein-like MFS transporter
MGKISITFGAAAIMSVNTALVRIIYPQRFLGRGIGINALLVAVSSAAGPTVAAVVLSFANWPWLFAIILPIGLVAFVLGLKYLPINSVKTQSQKFDFISGLLNALTFFSIHMAHRHH